MPTRPLLLQLLLSLSAFAVGSSRAHAALEAPYDRLVDYMVAEPADILAELQAPAGEPYFDRPIPPTIHQVWFGSAAALLDEDALAWQELAAQFGYAYHLWTEEDDASLRRMMGDELFALMESYRQAGIFMAASDIARYVIIDQLGGIYLDVDVPAPRDDGGALLDLRTILPLRGLVVPTEGLVREVGNGAIYLQNCIIMACPGHPIIHRMVTSLLPNHRRWRETVGTWNPGVWYTTGQHLLARSLAGGFSLLPYAYLEQVGMAYWQPVEERQRRARRAEARRAGGVEGAVRSIHRAAAAPAGAAR